MLITDFSASHQTSKNSLHIHYRATFSFPDAHVFTSYLLPLYCKLFLYPSLCPRPPCGPRIVPAKKVRERDAQPALSDPFVPWYFDLRTLFIGEICFSFSRPSLFFFSHLEGEKIGWIGNVSRNRREQRNRILCFIGKRIRRTPERGSYLIRR